MKTKSMDLGNVMVTNFTVSLKQALFSVYFRDHHGFKLYMMKEFELGKKTTYFTVL